ncbi:MAG: FixH family protein [Ramlibacter sp.]
MNIRSAIGRPQAVGLIVALLGFFCPLAHAQSAAAGSGRPNVALKCVSYGTGPMLECVVDLKRRDGAPLDGAQLTLGALMPSMPMAHTVKPMKAAPTGVPGQYKATLELEMLGVWAVDVDVSGPVRDKVSRNLVVHECNGNDRCAATAAKPSDMAPMRHGTGHRH